MERDYKKELTKSIREELNRMKNLSNRPEHMPYYDSLLAPTDFKEEKIIAAFCHFFPIEFAYATSVKLVRLCAGVYNTIHPIEEFLPRDACPVVKSSLGLLKLDMPPYNSCTAILIPTVCAWKKKLGEIIDKDIEIWLLEIPHIKNTPEGRVFWIEKVKSLQRKLEELAGIKITRKMLKEAIRVVQRSQEAYRKIYEARKVEKVPIWGQDAMLIAQSYFNADILEWTRKTEQLASELEKRLNDGLGVIDNKALRVMLCGSPIIFPNFKVPQLIEELGGIIVTDEFCYSTRLFYDPVGIDEGTFDDMQKAIAERYLLPCTCPYFTPNDERRDFILQRIKDFKVDGVIYHLLKGCYLYNLELRNIEKILNKENIPVLRIETDYSPEDTEQLKIRIEAFLEMLKEKGG